MQIFLHKEENSEFGFSLLEILVVLAIMAIMLSLISVNFARTIEAVSFSRNSDAAVANIKIIRAEALLDQQSRYIITDDTQTIELKDLDAHQVHRFDVPEAWEIRGNTIKILSSGICLGGQVVFLTPEGRRREYVLAGPKCEITANKR